MGLPNWNPDSPGIRGVQHLDVGYATQSIGTATDVGTLEWEASRSGDIDVFQAFSSGPRSGLGSIYSNLDRPMIVDLVDAGSEAWGALAVSDFTVTAVTGGTGMFNENLTTPVTPSRLNGSNDGLFVACSTLNATLDAQFDTAAFALNQHVLAVEVIYAGNITLRVGRFDPGGQLWFRDFPFWSSGFTTGTCRWGETIVEAGAGAWSTWTPTKVRQFASGGSRKVRITCRGGPGAWALDRLRLRVYHIPERRRGVGIGTPASGWVSFSMQTPPATGTSPVVTSGNDYTMMMRRISPYNVDSVDTATMAWRLMRGTSPDGNWRRHQQSYNPNFTPGAAGQSLMPAPGPQIDGILAARMLDGGTVVGDSMPYQLSRGAVCYDTKTVSQLMTMPGGATIYGQVFVVAGWVPTDGRPAGPLRAELYDSGGVKIFDAVEITAADVDRLPVSAPVSNVDDQGASYKTVRLLFPDSGTLSAAQYEVRFSSADSTAARPWRIAALIGDAHTTDQTWAGATDRAEGEFLDVPGFFGTPVLTQLSDGSRSSDLLTQLVEVPPPVTDVATSIGSVAGHRLDLCGGGRGCSSCADDTVPFVNITWAPAASGTAGYQVDRMDDLSPDWERVASVIDATSWGDHEARIAVRSQYRVRSIRNDGVTGDWSDVASATIVAGQVALSFSSNAATGMGCVYPEVWESKVITRQWRFLEAAQNTRRRFYGRNRPVSFRPAERPGDAWARRLLLSAFCSVTRPSMAVFHPLRELAYAPIPYVCVRDGEGNRWYANVEVDEGENVRDEGPGLWTADVNVAEVADRPAVVDTSVAQVTQAVQL